MKIIGFSGKKQGGKTTAVNYLADQILSCDIISFASYLKEIVLNCFGEIDENGNNLYERNVFGDLDEDKEVTLPCGDTVRQLLQWLGTNVMRSKDPECWIKAYKARVLKAFQPPHEAEVVLTPDVRFPNEVSCIQNMGGHVVRLTRSPHLDDVHESEISLDDMSLKHNGIYCRRDLNGTIDFTKWEFTEYEKGFDAMIDNTDMSIEERNKAVWKLVNGEGWI